LDLDYAQASTFYEQMLLIRRFEEQSGRLYMAGKIRGFLHLYIGQEAVAVGAMSTLRSDDYIITHYRDHGHALARGMDPNIVMAELLGKATGSSGGKGGSMHLFDVSKGLMGGHAIVGAHLPIAVGLALSAKYKGEDRIAVCFFGDGAVNQGEFHEALNMASLWDLPVLFFLENNLYGMGTHVERAHAGGRDIFHGADAYRMPALQVDGMDIVDVREGTMRAVERIRSQGGPVLLEAMTYRFVGHSVQDPEAYRDSAEIDEYRARDPIVTFRDLCVRQGLISEDEAKRIEDSVDDAVAEATRFAEESQEPSPESLYDNVFDGSSVE
jgi:pyruvate dehydrogenase E1 component alpha subunit